MIKGLSIVIPTLNEEHFIPKLLRSLTKQDYKGDFEIIVVDGKSKDRTMTVAKRFKDQLNNLHLISTKQGIGHQRNIGANSTRFNHLIFLDADTILPRNFLSTIAKKSFDNERFVAIPLVLPLNGSVPDYIYTFLSYIFKLLVAPIKPIITGKCIITTKENHKKINGFDESAIYAEDVDYGLRAVANGAKYYIFLGSHIYSSTRRKKQIPIIKASILQFRAYLEVIWSGAITDKSKYKYKFGNHIKE